MGNLKKSRVAKAASVFVGLTTAFMMVGGVAVLPAGAVTAADLQAQITALQAQLNAMQGSTTTTTGTTVSGFTFSTNLKLGSTGEDVRNLQRVLNSMADTHVAASGAGSSGNESTYFGALTKAAVIKFQEKYASDILTPLGLTKGTGAVYAATRAKFNSLVSQTTTTTTTTTTTGGTTVSGTGLTVTAGTQPAATLAVGGAARVPFTRVTFTASPDGDVTVTGVTVQRTGLASDASFEGLVLLDENGMQLGVEKTLDSNHSATVGDSFVVKAGQSRTMTIAANMNSQTITALHAGDVAALSVVAVQTAATVTGSLPITGAAQTVNGSLSIGTVTMQRGSYDPGSTLTKEVGSTGINFASVRVTAGSAEQVYLRSIRWNQAGSAASSDLANVVTVVDGTSYPTVVSSDGKYYTTSFGGNGLLIDKGANKEVTIRGDIAGGSGRTATFDIYRRTDLDVLGATYGYGIVPPDGTNAVGTPSLNDSGFHTGNPWYDGSLLNVSAGTLTVNKGASVAAQNISVNVSSQVLGGFDYEVKGEPISVGQMIYHFQLANAGSATVAGITSVSLYDSNGAVVAGPFDASGSGTYGTVTLSNTVTMPIGLHTYTLKGKLGTTFPSNATIVASTTPSSDWTQVTGQTTGTSITLPSSAATGNTMTVKGAAVAVSEAASPVAQSVVSGGTAYLFANYVFDATASGEDVRFNSIPLKLTVASGAATALTNCQLYDSTGKSLTTGSNVVNPTAASNALNFTFDNSGSVIGLVIPKGTTQTIGLKCNVNGTGSFNWGIDSTQTFSATGVLSGNSLTGSSGITVTSATGPLMALTGVGTLTVVADPNYSQLTNVAAGYTTGNVLGYLRFHAANEQITLQKISLQMSNSTASSTSSDLKQVTLWDGSTQVGVATFSSGRFATSTLTSSFVIPKDGDKTLTLKVDTEQIGTGLPGHNGALVQIDYNGDDLSGTQGTGAQSGANILSTSAADTTLGGVRVFRSYPVFTYSSTAGVATNGTNDLIVLNVAANSAGDVQLRKLTFSVATTTATLTTPTFNGPSGSVGTVALSADGTTITVTFDSTSNVSDRAIAAGQSKSYTLRGLVALTGTNTTGSVTVALKSDSAYPSLATTLMGTVAQLAAYNTIWSPNATGTSDVANPDWTNAYNLVGVGCYTNGIGSDCTARTISK
jgi:hypothetical protein